MKLAIYIAIGLFIAHSLYSFGRDAAQRIKPSECTREAPVVHQTQTELA